MKFLNLKGVFLALLLSVSSLWAHNIVAVNQGVLSDAVSKKISDLGEELKQKSGIFVGLGVFDSLDGKSLKEAFEELDLKSPYAFLMLAKNERKVEIFADDDTTKLFDKERILSPFPNKGSILPILTSKNGKDVYNAAMLNGYADLAEQIAASKNISLVNAVGNQNKTALNFFRILIYGSLALVIFVAVSRKFRRRNE